MRAPACQRAGHGGRMSEGCDLDLTEAATPRDFAVARVLFQEYAAQLEIDLCFQGFDAELNELASMYAPPGGSLMLARRADRPIGCGAIRRFSEGICEMKRLYLRPEARGTGLGRILVERLLLKARTLGYVRIYLDTLVDMHQARRLYGSLGFRETDPYCGDRLPGLVYMQLDLIRG